jgi:hypothetical protein
MRWEVRKSPQVIAITNAHDAPEGLNDALKRFFDGIPDDAEHLFTRDDGIEAWRWLKAGCWIIFTVDRTVNRRTIRVTLIERVTEA